VSKVNSGCHSGISYSRRCPAIKNSSEASDLVSAFYRHYYRHKLVNVPSCVMSVYFPGVSGGFEGSGSAGESESDDSESESSLGTVGIIVVVVVIVGILVIGVVIYFVVRK
jgi:hypothetical protein